MLSEDTLALEQTAATHKANTNHTVHGWFQTTTDINEEYLPQAVNLLIATERLSRMRDPQQIISTANEINTALEQFQASC